MRTYSAGMLSHLQQRTTTLAWFVKATLTNGTIYGFTSFPKRLTVDGVVYRPGFTPTGLATNDRLNVDNMEIMGALTSDAIAEVDIRAGLWDYAEIEIFQANHADLSMGKKDSRRGWLGEVKTGRMVFTAEFNSLSQKLQQTIGELESATCRATLGDSKCQVNLAPFTFTGTVVTVSNRRQFYDSGLTQADAYFDYGKITWVSGLNTELTNEVKTFTGGSVTLQFPMPYDIQVGDTFSVIAGCNKVLLDDATTGVPGHCKNKFNNVVNFRGAGPWVPERDKLYRNP